MLVSFWMTQRLTRELHELRNQMMEKTMQLSKYQKYAGILGGSSVLGINNIAGISSELLPRASLFAQYSDQASSMSAMQNLQAMKMMGRIPITGNQMTQMQLEFSAFNQFKQEALKALKQQEVAHMNEMEKQIQLELSSIKHRIDIKEQQLESYKSLNDKRIDDMVPKFG